ncbi:spore cortex biosynthesis protein YabQ [Niallia sp. 01092]|uniref:spore cortex biosynthesis protein YabQ n=1 Tax=unclassified Niallia TaxID=2837522 RepID=UPI003FCFD292
MTLSVQFMTMLAMVGMGLLFGLCLDTYQYFLKRPERKRIIVFFHDLLFWIFQALLIFYVLFLVNQGEVRVYIALALVLGFAFYQSIVKTPYLRSLKWFISISVQFYHFIVKLLITIVYKPIRSLVLLLVSIMIILFKGLMALSKFVVTVLRFILKILFMPIKWIFTLFWLIMPNKGKKYVEKFFSKFAGYSNKIKNYWITWISNRKKQ